MWTLPSRLDAFAGRRGSASSTSGGAEIGCDRLGAFPAAAAQARLASFFPCSRSPLFTNYFYKFHSHKRTDTVVRVRRRFFLSDQALARSGRFPGRSRRPEAARERTGRRGSRKCAQSCPRDPRIACLHPVRSGSEARRRWGITGDPEEIVHLAEGFSSPITALLGINTRSEIRAALKALSSLRPAVSMITRSAAPVERLPRYGLGGWPGRK